MGLSRLATGKEPGPSGGGAGKWEEEGANATTEEMAQMLLSSVLGLEGEASRVGRWGWRKALRL